MSAGYIALIFCALAILAVFGIRRDLQQGWARSGGFRYYADQNPVGYWLSIGGRAFIILLAAAEVAHAFGLAPDPIVLMRSLIQP
jgi:hypothetical protein